LEQLTARQIAEWEAYHELEPFGDWKHDFELSYLLSVMTNLFLGAYGKKSARLTKPEDFLIKWGDAAKEDMKQQTPEDMKQFMLSFMKAHNAKVDQKIKKRGDKK
jgi:hypothetical protein